MCKQTLWRLLSPLMLILAFSPLGARTRPAEAQEARVTDTLIHKVTQPNERMEMTVGSSRRLVLGQNIPEAQVQNPAILELTPLAPDTIQVSAKESGVTQVSLWGQDGKVYTIDVIVYADAQALTMLLKSQFPSSVLKVIPVASGVLISGYVDQAEQVDLVIRIAEDYYPKVINNMTVSGVQQVLLKVKVMEVSRTKLRTLGFDFSVIAATGSFVSTPAGILAGAETIAFDVIGNDNTFTGVLEALREDKLGKILAEPNIVAVSGRPSFFEVGGEVGYVQSTSNTGVAQIGWKEYGTRVDFVAIVLGNGRIRLEVRPRISEIDPVTSINGQLALRTRTADTGVELQAGQTLAIAGLVQDRVEATNRGLPWVSELPYLGTFFRRVEEKRNEVELLILVTPELVDAMDASEVPPCGPGMRTTSPNDGQLFLKGHLEVPNCGPTGAEGGCASCVGPASPGAAAYPDGMMGQPDGAPLDPQDPSAAYNRYNSSKSVGPQTVSRAARPNSGTSFIGPIGYDVIR